MPRCSWPSHFAGHFEGLSETLSCLLPLQDLLHCWKAACIWNAYDSHNFSINYDILATCQMEVATCVDFKMRHDKSLNMDGLKALKILEAIFPWPQRLHVMAWFLWNPGSAQDARPTSRSVRVVRPVGSLFRRKGQCGCGWWLCRDGIWCARARYCPHISLPLQRIPLIYF